MINVPQAKEEMMSITRSLPRTVLINSMEAAGCILAEDLIAPADLPPFDQSAADGYAVKLSSSRLSFCQLISEIQTGTYQSLRIEKRSMVRIHKGEPVPPGTDCIIAIGNIISRGNRIIAKNFIPIKGHNIRYKGAEFKQGNIVLRKGTLLSAASTELLCSLRIDKVKVLENPSASKGVCGDDLITDDRPLLSQKPSTSASLVFMTIFKKINIALNKFLIRMTIDLK